MKDMIVSNTSTGRWTASLFPGLLSNNSVSLARKPMDREDILTVMQLDFFFAAAPVAVHSRDVLFDVGAAGYPGP
jgi:hypothetical protein